MDRLASLKTQVAKTIVARWKELRAPALDRITTGPGRVRFWQRGGGFDRKVRDTAALCREVRYIHRNPVERELVESPEDWARSSVRWWMGDTSGPVAVTRRRAMRWRGRSGRGTRDGEAHHIATPPRKAP